ncbi:hypothetical protein B1693_17350, partial [Geobacillus zalihae]
MLITKSFQFHKSRDVLSLVPSSMWMKTIHPECSKRSIPVRSFSGDLIKKSPLGMMQGCQTHHSPYQ